MEQKKNKKYDLESKRPLFFGLGLIIALGLVVSAFEWRSEIEPIIGPEPIVDIWVNSEIVEVTTHEKPKAPKPMPKKKPIEVVEAKNELKKAAEEIELDMDPTEEMDDESVEFGFAEPDEKVEVPFIFVESMPEFPGGTLGLMQYFAKNTKFPRTAKRMGVDGTVTVQFIIEKDGSISNVKVLKGIGFGCDIEAKRVVEHLPDFTPGKQRGVPVRVQMAVPINFRLE